MSPSVTDIPPLDPTTPDGVMFQQWLESQDPIHLHGLVDYCLDHNREVEAAWWGWLLSPDRPEPYQTDPEDSQSCWHWYAYVRVDDSQLAHPMSDVGPELWSRLEGRNVGGTDLKYYLTLEAAWRDLRQAYLRLHTLGLETS